ncbi:MAG: hypothetical protein ACTSXW_07535 [Candidatus Baldrarchaeia archaeon]
MIFSEYGNTQHFMEYITSRFEEILQILILVGNIAAVITIIVGCIMWFSRFDPNGGKRLFLYGIILAIIIKFLATLKFSSMIMP